MQQCFTLFGCLAHSGLPVLGRAERSRQGRAGWGRAWQEIFNRAGRSKQDRAGQGRARQEVLDRAGQEAASRAGQKAAIRAGQEALRCRTLTAGRQPSGQELAADLMLVSLKELHCFQMYLKHKVCCARQGRAGQGRAGQGRAGPGRVVQVGQQGTLTYKVCSGKEPCSCSCVGVNDSVALFSDALTSLNSLLRAKPCWALTGPMSPN